MTTPLWREDFPLTSAGEDAVTRREFVRYLVLASFCLAAIIAYVHALQLSQFARAEDLPDSIRRQLPAAP